MTDVFDWRPYILVLELFCGFIGLCIVAALSDLWAKSLRRPSQKKGPVVVRQGQRIYLN